MRKSVLILVAFMLAGVTIKAQWNESYTGVIYPRDVSIVNDNVIWIGNTSDSIFSFTTDGGDTWVSKFFPTSLYKTGYHGVLSAVSATTAYIVYANAGSANGIYKTTNSGNTWIRQSTGFNQNSLYPNFVYFWDENNGVAVGDANPDFEIYTTNNGGVQWNSVPTANMPSGNSEWTWNDRSDSYRVHGDTIYFLASGSNEQRIFKSTNKGLNWTVINTPFKNVGSFDFKDKNNGLFSVRGTSARDTIYSTVDGGQNWTKTNTILDDGRYLNYLPSVNAYFLTGKGLSYSSDNGKTWTVHPSFNGVWTFGVGYSPSGKIFIGAYNGFVYNSSNYSGTNLAINRSQFVGSKNIDITFSANVDLQTSQNTANYGVYFYLDNSYQRINVLSAVRDNSNNSLVHLVTEFTIPYDTITISVGYIKDLKGFPIIIYSVPAYSTIINTKTGIEKEVFGNMTIYPNPANDVLTIKNIPNHSTLNIYDIQGRLIKNIQLNSTIETFNVANLGVGTYIVKITSINGNTLRKLIIE